MADLREQLLELQKLFDEDFAKILKSTELDDIRVRFLGKKGELTAILRGMKDLYASDRPKVGELANQVRAHMEKLIADKMASMQRQAMEQKLQSEQIDITLPGAKLAHGVTHPLSRVTNDIVEVFMGMGFSVVDGPEIEFTKLNFDWLGTAEDHPSREESDTFYINDDMILRTQTSPAQIRTLLRQEPPLRIICPGMVYRPDALDAKHSPVFHQIEGLVVDKNVTMGHLVASLELYASSMFGEHTKIRLRPHHFPFTEPSCEVDITCPACGGVNSEDCRMCRGEGYIEVLGAGMVHPDVLRNGGIDPEIYSGFAFGIGVERTAMCRYGIKDIRDFFDNDLRFLAQFQA